MKLLFVYNADSGPVNAVLDGMHKVLSPSTYNCKLCQLTYGTFSENKVWKEFRENTPVDMRFLHKDEFQKEFRSKWLPKYDFPIVLTVGNEGLEMFITAEEFTTIATPEALIQLIQARLSLY
jgi:hypothetical protein